MNLITSGPWWEEHKVTKHEIPQSWKREEVYNMGPSSLWWKGQQGGSEYRNSLSPVHSNTNNECLQAKMLDRTVGKPEDQDQDNQLNQFVPDLNVVGKSSTLGQVCVLFMLHITYVGWVQNWQHFPSVKNALFDIAFFLQMIMKTKVTQFDMSG